MSEENCKKSINWGGLIKGLAAGAAVVAGIMLLSPGLLPGIAETVGGWFSSGGAPVISEGVQTAVRMIAGAAMSITGLSYLFSDKSAGHDSNADRHSEAYHEAKESFAVREDMRKMQTVMMMRMQAAGHQPAMAMAAQPQR